jgi:hypothetical protein
MADKKHPQPSFADERAFTDALARAAENQGSDKADDKPTKPAATPADIRRALTPPRT